jgi:DNA repair exonuclease SbcCD nuclease subunit
VRALLVGDVHAVESELEDCQNLIDYVEKVAKEEKVDLIIFMGDLYNNHAVMRVEVMAFWQRAFDQLEFAAKSLIILVGNHDFAGEGLTDHALMAHGYQIQGHIVSEYTVLKDGVGALAYTSDKDVFVQNCKMLKDMGCDTILCHQTFSGAKYDNGMYAPDGLDPEAIPQTRVISGHIHAPQSFGKVTYIGAPRWRTLSDANVDRSIVVYDFVTHERKDFPTAGVCREIRYYEDTPDSPLAMDTFEKASSVDWRIDIKGPADYIEARKLELSGKARVRTFKTDKPQATVRESDGVDLAFERFLSNYTSKYGTPKDRLQAAAHERLNK